MPLINRDIPAPPAWPPPKDGDGVAALLRYARERDPVGHRVHTALAMLYLVLLPFATAPKDFALAILVGYTLLRLPNIWRCFTPLLRDRLLWAMLAWGVVHAISIAWSLDPIEGWTEVKVFRVIAVPLTLWPVLDRAPRLIGAFLLGVFVLDLFQLAQLLGWFGMEVEGADRATGTLHPIQTAALNLAALTWYLTAMIRRGAVRPLAFAVMVAGAAAALGGLVASGSRGAWLAAAIALPALMVIGLLRRTVSARRTVVIACGLLIAGGAIWFAGGGSFVTSRLSRAIDDYRAAVNVAEYTGSVGQRVLLSKWSREFILESPAFGLGAGSFRERSRETAEYEGFKEMAPGRAERNKFTPAHPHNAYFHVLVSTGVIGLIPFAATLLIALRRAWKEPNDHLFAGAAFAVLIGWLLGTLSDCFNLNGHLFGLFAFIVAITLPNRASCAHEGDEDVAA